MVKIAKRVKHTKDVVVEYQKFLDMYYDRDNSLKENKTQDHSQGKDELKNHSENESKSQITKEDNYYDIILSKQIQFVMENGIESILWVISEFSEIRKHIVLRNFRIENSGNEMHKQQIKDNFIKNYRKMNEKTEEFFLKIAILDSQLQKLNPKIKELMKIHGVSNWCAFLLILMFALQENQVYSKMRNDIEELFMENLSMYENEVEKIEKRVASEQIQEKDLDSLLEKLELKIESESDKEYLLKAFRLKPEVFNELELYKEKINEVYGESDILISIRWDHEDDWAIHLDTQKSFPLEELEKRRKQFKEWHLNHKYLQFVSVHTSVAIDRDIKQLLKDILG